MQAGPVEPGVLGARLRQQQLIEDPQLGEREPLELEARGVLWPHAAQWALIQLVQVTDGGARRLEEYRFTPAGATADVPAFQGRGLPVAVLFERTPNGASRARLYATAALRSPHRRSLSVDSHLRPEHAAADVLGRLAGTLREGDVDATLALFEDKGSLQETDGAVRRGSSEIGAALERLFRQPGAIGGYCTRLDEGARSALELQVEGERPALLVCDRGARGLLSSVRLYG